MKFKASALVFFSVFGGGCHPRTGEAVAAPGSAEVSRSAQDAGALDGRALEGGAARPLTGVELSAKHPRSRTSPAAETCVDRWLQEHGFDRYGSAQGTMYAGGTPLFDERTGVTRDRLDWVYEQHPDAKRVCAGKRDAGVSG